MNKPFHISDAEFEARVLNSELPVIVDSGCHGTDAPDFGHVKTRLMWLYSFEIGGAGIQTCPKYISHSIWNGLALSFISELTHQSKNFKGCI